MPPKKKKAKKTKFLAKHRTAMVTALDEDHADVVKAVIDKLPTGIQLERYESRKKFVALLCGDTAKEALARCVECMVNNFLELYKQYMKGKRFMQFEQAWMEHIHNYFNCPATEIQNTQDGNCCYFVWQAVLDKCKCSVDDEDQRIVVSTLVYAVYDLMTDKVKEYKKQNVDSLETTTCTDMPTTFCESKVSLYRYGGFALHSLLKKYYKHTQKPCTKDILSTLRHLRVRDDQLDILPHAVRQLNQGGLDIISPSMLPFVKSLVEKVRSLVNEERCRDFGQHMIETACDDINKDTELTQIFSQCVQDAGVNTSSVVVSRLYSELSKKIFHARVNEYMTASVEVELERSGKAVKADQSLRDQLKTFSALKTRS